MDDERISMNLPDELGWERHPRRVRANAKAKCMENNMSLSSPPHFPQAAPG